MIHRARITNEGARLKIESPEPLFRPPLLTSPYDSQSFAVTGQPATVVAVTSSSQNDSGYVLATYNPTPTKQLAPTTF